MISITQNINFAPCDWFSQITFTSHIHVGGIDELMISNLINKKVYK